MILITDMDITLTLNKSACPQVANKCQRRRNQTPKQMKLKCEVLCFPVCIWALRFLSTSEDVQDKLYQELDEVLGSDPVSLDKIPQLR